MDIVSGGVLRSSGAAAAPAGAALAPLVVSVSTHLQHEQQAASFVTAAAPQPNASQAAGPLAPETPAKARLMHPISSPAGAPSVAPGEDVPPVRMHRPLSLTSLHDESAPELLPIAEDSMEDAEETAVRSNAQQQPLQSNLAAKALAVLRANDLGGYTIPATGLYPYQWNWDSALVAMGWSAVDEPRAWEELR